MEFDSVFAIDNVGSPANRFRNGTFFDKSAKHVIEPARPYAGTEENAWDSTIVRLALGSTSSPQGPRTSAAEITFLQYGPMEGNDIS